MASYWPYYRHLGLKDDICNELKISNIPSTIYHLFCADCPKTSSVIRDEQFMEGETLIKILLTQINT